MENWKKAYYAENPYKVETSQNGKKYVTFESVRDDQLNFSLENSKVGKVLGFNFPIHYTCNHACECYKKGKCYGCTGCYNFMCNQALYSENLAYFFHHTEREFVDTVNAKIIETGYNMFRWFEIGDIFSYTFFRDVMVKVALENENIRFWSYTKKYDIVNRFIEDGGVIPENLTIVFSHWLNEDGTYFPMNNPYNMPTSEFIPIGKEELTENVTHICPCSDPDVVATCATCEHPCYKLERGQSMALLEHSTKETRKRDKAVKAAHDRIKKGLA